MLGFDSLGELLLLFNGLNSVVQLYHAGKAYRIRVIERGTERGFCIVTRKYNNIKVEKAV